jgi:ABC-type transport system involved in multi-copper enzyme maturation permease subunit
MLSLKNLLYVTLKWSLRDRVFHAVCGVALFLFLLVPSFSLFSMRQVQELSITLSLSAISFTLLVLATLLGSSSIWRDLERRYVASVLTLPLPRSSYVLGKFAGIALLLMITAISLGAVSLAAIKISALQYPSDIPIHWGNIVAAVVADSCKYVLLAALAMLLSSISTSFFLPIFGTISVYLAGSASQEVIEFVSGDYGRTIPPAFRLLVKGLYYLLPNFSAFNLKVQAIYGLPITLYGLCLTLLYFVTYTAIVLTVTTIFFKRRELP